MHLNVRFTYIACLVKFLVAEKESATSSYKMYTVSLLLTKALLVVGLYELQVLKKAQGSTETRRPGDFFFF